MQLVGVPSYELNTVWNDVKSRVAEILERFSDDEYTIEDVEKMILARDAQLWTTTDKDAIYITQILIKKNHKELFGWMFHADLLKDGHWQLWESVKEWAKSQGCTKQRVVIRPGFEKAFAKHGWNKRHITMTQEI
jgi:hypothetical protein